MTHTCSELSYAKSLGNAFAPINLSPPVVAEFLKIAVHRPDTHTRSRIPGRESLFASLRVTVRNGVVRLLRIFE
jgi:hypothetical protein